MCEFEASQPPTQAVRQPRSSHPFVQTDRALQPTCAPTRRTRRPAMSPHLRRALHPIRAMCVNARSRGAALLVSMHVRSRPFVWPVSEGAQGAFTFWASPLWTHLCATRPCRCCASCIRLRDKTLWPHLMMSVAAPPDNQPFAFQPVSPRIPSWRTGLPGTHRPAPPLGRFGLRTNYPITQIPMRCEAERGNACSVESPSSSARSENLLRQIKRGRPADGIPTSSLAWRRNGAGPRRRSRGARMDARPR